jgi:hypothetical protein
MSEVANLLLNTTLIREIKELSAPNLANSCAFKDFINKLTPHVNKLENFNDWQNNIELLSFLDEINNEINNQFNSDENGMTTTNEVMVNSAVTMGAGAKVSIALLLLGVAIGAIYLARQDKIKYKNKNKESSADESVDKSIQAGSITTKENSTGNISSLPYEKYKLLLIVPANRLDPELKIGSISNNEINVLIVNAIRAYCFSVGNKKGNQVMQAVECSDSQIDYKTENRIFLQLELSAGLDIITERDNLGIRSKIQPNSNGNLLQIQTLKTARSTSEFYLI